MIMKKKHHGKIKTKISSYMQTEPETRNTAPKVDFPKELEERDHFGKLK